MLGSIKIDINESGVPVIKIEFFPGSDDLRDKTIQRFIERVGSEKGLSHLIWEPEYSPEVELGANVKKRVVTLVPGSYTVRP